MELLNAVRGLGYSNAFKHYKIPLKDIKKYLTSYGIPDNENFASISSIYDQFVGVGQIEHLLANGTVVRMS